MALTWSSRRKLLYTSVVGVGMLVVFFLTYQVAFNQAPTCFDGSQNGNERGVDCGGSCALVCKSEARAPVVLWSRAFKVAPQVYTAAAYVQNPNIGAGAHKVGYTFQLFDDKNILVVERQGTIDIPPVQMVPFIDPNINVGNRTVARAIFAFTQDPVWQKQGSLPILRTGNQYLAADGSLLSATIHNDSPLDAKAVTVEAVLFDASGTARAASKSLIPTIPHRGSQDVTFTWSGGVPDITRAEITVLPSF